jgi:hypothetical protein
VYFVAIEAGDLDLARGDRLDVDAVLREDAEHLRRDARVRAHPQAHDRHLDDVLVVADVDRADLAAASRRSTSLHPSEIGLRHGEGHVGVSALLAPVGSTDAFWMIMSTLTFLAASAVKISATTTRLVAHADEHHAGLTLVVGDAR